MSAIECEVPEPQAPERSLAQRMAALESANHIRSYRKGLKDDLKSQRRLGYEVIAEPEDEVLTMKVFDLLLAMPKIGRVKANKWLSYARVSPSKTIGGITYRQRVELLAIMRAPGRARLRAADFEQARRAAETSEMLAA